jgi:hypothetical protein
LPAITEGSPPGARLSLIAYASACAWGATYPERLAEGWAKYGLAGEAIAAEHKAWREYFDGHPEERTEFLQRVEGFKGHWRR